MPSIAEHDKALYFEHGELTDDVGCAVLVLSEETILMAHKFISHYGYWRNRYVQDADITPFAGVTDAEWYEIQDVVDRALEELNMASCNEIITAIEGLTVQIGLINTSLQASINASLNVSGCCSPYGGEIPETAPDQPNPITDPPPTGFATWDDYWAYKCGVANRIADDWIGTLDNLQTLGGLVGAIAGIALGLFFNTTLLGGLLVGLMAIGFSAGAAAALIIGLLVALVAGGAGLFAYFAALSAAMESDKETLVCELFNSTSVQAAKQIVLDFTSSKALGLTYDPDDDEVLFQATVAGMADALFNETVLNGLFALDTSLEGYVGDVDCDNCAAPCPVFDGTYYYACSAKIWCQVDTSGFDWLIREKEKLIGIPDGLTAYYQKYAAGGSEAGCDATVTFNMWITLDFGVGMLRPVLSALTMGDATNRLPTVSWSNDPAAFLDFNHASWNNPSGNDNWYTPGAVLVWSTDLVGSSSTYRYAKLKLGGETTDPNGVQAHIDAIRMRPFV